MEIIENSPGSRLKEFRKAERLSQKHLADLLGYDQRKISRLERDESEISANILNTLNDAYSINADWLLKGNGKMYGEKAPSENEVQAEIDLLRAENKSLKEKIQLQQETIDAQKLALNLARKAFDKLEE